MIRTIAAASGAALLFAAAAFADPGERGSSKKIQGKMTFSVSTTDNGSCGSRWATETLKRTFQVKDNGNGTWRVTRVDRGTFVTTGGTSPGKCNPRGRHGTTVRAGVRGTVVGYLRGTVTGGTFNPNATCAQANCGFTTPFIRTFFGASARWSCSPVGAGCTSVYNYTAPRERLRYRHWQRKTRGGAVESTGDIADA
jgi:hypothetical protein